MSSDAVPQPRVFVSSVMQGYAPFRAAARRGIRRAGYDPVMAEDIPSQPASPRTACLDAVRSADALVLILGRRYGWVAPSGRSPTEEEYREAVSHHRPIFVFLEQGVPRDTEQQAFCSAVEDYVHGHFRRTFSTPSDLQQLVEEAVSMVDIPTVSGSQSQADSRIISAIGRRPMQVEGHVWLKIAWTTLRDEEVTDPLHFDDQTFEQVIQGLAHSSNPSLFTYTEGKTVQSTASYFRIQQGSPHDHSRSTDQVTLTIHAEGTVTVLQNVTRTDNSTDANRTFVNAYHVYPDVAQRRLERAWAAVAAWWGHEDPHLRHDPLIYNAALYDIGGRAFRRPAAWDGTVPPECRQNPMAAFDRARSVSRANLEDPATEIDRVIKMFRRRFADAPGGHLM